MKIFQLIEVDVDKARARAQKPGLYTKREQKALLALYDKFEQGDWQGCLDLVNNKKVFRRNIGLGYPETEHIVPEVSNILGQMGMYSFFTADQIAASLSR